MNRTPLRLGHLLGLLLCAAPAHAQDSTANVSGLPGDSLDPHVPGEQCNDFVTELAAVQSSLGNAFGVAPLIKASMDHGPSPNFFNARMGSQAHSAHVLPNVPFARTSYMRWTAPGFGVNATANNPGTILDTSGKTGRQFAVAFAEDSSDFPGAPTYAFNNIIGAVVNFDAGVPSRLYVSRIVGAVNSPNWTCNLSQFGMGAVDAHGNLNFRADGFGSFPCGASNELFGDSYFRVRLLDRACGTLNVISGSGGSDATTWVLQASPTIHNVPNIVPAAVTGAASLMIGSNFAGQFVHGVGPLLSTTAHLGGAADHRGAVAYSLRSFPTLFGAGAVNGTSAILSRTGSATDRLSLFGLDVGGAPVGAISRQLPASISDPKTGFSGGGQFIHFFSQTAYRGGSSQVALGRDQAGRLLAAATAYHSGATGGASLKNMIAVARVSSAATEWRVAAYTNGANGKPIEDASGATIGRLVDFDLVGTSGPSISPPMIDSVGNVWFVSSFQLDAGPQGVGLFRAVYDPASFSYSLELVLRSGQVIRGANSDRDYLVRFISLVGGTGLSSAAPFSGNIAQVAFDGADPSALDPRDSRTLGGLVISVNLVYDVNGDGLFETIDASPATQDQEYNVALYVTSARDCNGNGVPDDLDILLGTSQDLDGDGVPDECALGVAFCLGDGSGNNCPCGNPGGPGTGCMNSTGQGGRLGASGSASLSAANLVLEGSQLVAGTPGLYYQANNPLNGGLGVLFGDGLRCIGGGVVRIQVRVSDAAGLSATTVNVGAVGLVSPGMVKHYQLWYRDPIGSVCGTQFNLTNAISVTWLP